MFESFKAKRAAAKASQRAEKRLTRQATEPKGMTLVQMKPSRLYSGWPVGWTRANSGAAYCSSPASPPTAPGRSVRTYAASVTTKASKA